MKNPLKIILGLITLVPYIVTPLLFIFEEPGPILNPILSNLTGLMMYSLPILWIMYITHVYRRSNVESNQKHLWAALLFFGHFVIFPVYWYLHIWREPKKV